MMGDACLCLDVETEYEEWIENPSATSADTAVCGECRRTIPAGAPHYSAAGVFENDEGEQETECATIQCLLCHAVVASMFSCGWWFGEVWNQLRDHMLDVMPHEEEDDGDDNAWLDPPTAPIGPGGW